MCEICHSAPCLSRCPNAPEPKTVFECSGCGGMILEGDYYWEIMNEQWCEACISNARREAEYDADE